MKHVVSFSGGRTSAYLVYLMEQKRKNEGWDVDYVFMDTGAEHPKTYEFIRNVVKHWDVNLYCIKSKITQEKGVGPTYEEVSVKDIGWDLSRWREFVKKYGSPSVSMGKCTDRLKTVPHDKFCNDKFGRKNYITWLGIRADEPKRLKDNGWIRYLADISYFNKQDILDWWIKQPFDLDLDEWLGNCVFCVKKGLNRLAVATKQEPELLKEWIAMTKHSNQERAVKNQEMYRGKLTIEGIAEMYKNKNTEDIVSTMRIKKGCAVEQGESCEVFGCQTEMDI